MSKLQVETRPPLLDDGIPSRPRASLGERLRELTSPDRPGVPLLSFVVPVYNEEENLRPLCARIASTCDAHAVADYEVVLVENGSWDSSEQVIRDLHAADQRVKMLQLSRNFGYQGGLSAGLAHARGDWIAVLDGDQQDPPELIPAFLERALEGFDVVYGIRAKRAEGILKRAGYRAFYRLWKATAQISVPVDAGDFCVMHRRVVRALVAMPERQRFLRGLRAWSGFRQTGYPYERHGRALGESKFGLGGLLSIALDGLLAYSVIPLRLMTWAGLVVSSGSFLLGTLLAVFRVLTWMGVHAPLGVVPPGLTQINVLITFLLGFNILCVGVLGEYVGRIYEEVKQRPIYLVRAALLEDRPRGDGGTP